MSNYIVLSGDTFESISRKKYGVGTRAGDISGANPGALEPLSPGINLTIPPDVEQQPVTSKTNESGRENEVALNIEGKRFRFWTDIEINRSIDSFDTISFNAPLSINNTDFTDIFKPLSFKKTEVTIGGNVLFNGTMLSPIPDLKANSNTVSVTAYSLPAIMSDCTAPASAFPLEFDNMTILEIATRLGRLFGIRVESQGNVGAKFERVSLNPGKKINSFLIKLAKQRNLIMTNTPEGALLFYQSIVSGESVAQLEQGLAPLVSISPIFKSQEYYSHITGIEITIVGLKGSQYTVKNERLTGITRPFSFEVPDTLDSDVRTATMAKASRMFSNVVTYPISVSTWRDSNGLLWAPNTFITILAPGAMILQKYKFIIRDVSLRQEADKESATLNLVLPESFSGQMPEFLPWD